MATIQKRRTDDGETRYRALVRLNGHPNATATFRSKSDAQRWARETEASIRAGRYFKEQETRKHTVSEAIDRYIEHVLPNKPRSSDDYERHLNRWKQEIGDYRLGDVTPSVLAQCRDTLKMEEIRKEVRRSSSCVNRYVTSLGHCFSVATREWGWMDENPCRKLTKLQEPRGRVRYLSDEERAKLLEACLRSQNPFLHVIVLIALSTGMRRGEILRLTWADVDLARRMITVHETKNGERRSVPLVGKAHEVLAAMSKLRRIDTNLLFPSENPKRPIHFRTAFESALRRAGIEDFHFHDLRHSCASYLAMSGATEREIMEVLGHKTAAMAKRYSHLSEQHTAKVVERMASTIF